MFPFLIAFSAFLISVSSAFYSVSGLSKLFAGAEFAVILMAGSLEFAKLVTASLLYQYWDTINKTLRTYLSIATIVLILITSMGIYGFLSAAYQETYSKLSAVENQKGFIQQKINFYQNDVTRYDTEIERISSNISTLSNAKASTIQVRDTSVSGGFRQTISTTELRMAQSRINIEEENRKLAQSKRTVASDSLQKFQLQVLELDNNNDVAGELGPLQYLSSLTGYPMGKIINILLLTIIFVFDPLAISLVIAANFAFAQAYPPKKYRENLYQEQVEVEEEDFDPPNEVLKKSNHDFDWEAAEKRMNVIGQNGNDGEHYSEYDLNKDGVIGDDEKKILKEQIIKIKNKVGGNLQSHPEKLKEVQRLEKILNFKPLKDDLTKTY